MVTKGNIFNMMEKYAPVFWNSKNYRTEMMLTLILHDDFARDLEGYITYCEDNGISEHEIQSTIHHDVGGMMKSNNEHFLPRCSGYTIQ